jgi:hypothetical protein
MHTNPLQVILDRLDYDILDYVETKMRGRDELLPQKARDIGESVARLIEARFTDPESARSALRDWQTESLYGYGESCLVSLAVHLIGSIDHHIEMSRPLRAATTLPERPHTLARATGSH